MSVKINQKSCLRFAELMVAEGIEFWDLPDFPEIIPQEDDTTIEVDDQTQKRIDLLAYDAYGDEQLWWVLCLANGLDLVPTQLIQAKILKVPASRYVFNELLR